MLAANLGLQVEDLPKITGIGRRTLFECRSADSNVSAKSWAKLEVAESNARRTAGIPPTEPESQLSTLREDSPPYRFTPMAKQIHEALPGEARDLLLERIANALERLVELEERRKP